MSKLFSNHIDREWTLLDKPPIPRSLSDHLPYHRIVLQTLVQRGFTSLSSVQQFLDHKKYLPASPFDLPDMEKAVERITRARNNHQLVGVWGDFDVDGQTSTAILVATLHALNVKNIFHIPVRGRETHGIGLEALDEFISNSVDLILTCDTGVTAHESIAYAKSRGIDVVITDHHLLPDVLPEAVAVVNPRRLAADHPLATLPGAGTALKLAEALSSTCDSNFDPESLHDLAALGIIADLAELRADTRYLAQSGLYALRRTPRPALAALLAAAEVNHLNLTEEQVSFSLAPRLNAVGRLADANPIVNFLLSTDPAQIAVTVNQVEGLNSRRKLLCDQVFTGAQSMIEQNHSLLEHAALVLHHPEWPGGVVGIVASRLVEIYHRPVILLTGQPGESLRGSARSVEGIDITAVLRRNRELLLNFGGHPMAAGLSLEESNLSAFVRGLDRVLNEQVTLTAIKPLLQIDDEIYPSDISFELARSLEVLAPFGPGNPPLVFSCRNMQVTETRSVGKLGEHLLVDVEDPTGNVNRCIWWNGQGLPLPEGYFDLAYSSRATNYRGEDQVSLEWIDYRQLTDQIIPEIANPKKRTENIDLRSTTSPREELLRLIRQDPKQIWQEGNDKYGISGLSRDNLKAGRDLVIWTVPPNIPTLREIIRTVQPASIYWFLVSPAEHQLAVFLRQLARSIKDQFNDGFNDFDLPKLAASYAVSAQMIELGIKWLASKGVIQIEDHTADIYKLLPGGFADATTESRLAQSLKQIFRELQAFSNHLRKTDLDQLVEELR